MTLADDVYTICSNDATLTGLVSDRIYAWRQITSTFPQVVYRPPVAYDDTMARDHGGNVTRAEAIVQFDCYGSTGNEAEEVADALIDIWSGYQSKSPDVGYAFVSNKIADGYVASLDAFRVIVDVMMNVRV